MAVVADVHEDGEVRLASGCSIDGALGQRTAEEWSLEKGKICGLVGVFGPDRTPGRVDELMR